MKYFKDNKGAVWAFESDGSQDDFIPDGLTQISEAEADQLRSPPALNADELATQARADRDRLLRETVDTVNAIRWAAMTEAQRAAWAAYRQALLDVPEQPGFPSDIDWPQAPA